MIIGDIRRQRIGVELVINKDIIQTIRDKEMDRKDFLKYSGLFLLSIVGLKTIISLLTQMDTSKPVTLQQPKVEASGRGFGGGKYGA